MPALGISLTMLFCHELIKFLSTVLSEEQRLIASGSFSQHAIKSSEAVQNLLIFIKTLGPFQLVTWLAHTVGKTLGPLGLDTRYLDLKPIELACNSCSLRLWLISFVGAC